MHVLASRSECIRTCRCLFVLPTLPPEGQTDQTLVNLQEDVKELNNDFDSLLEQLARRACDIQNAVAAMHNTMNYVQNLLLVPAGQRPRRKC